MHAASSQQEDLLYHTLDTHSALAHLDSSLEGLPTDEAQKRLQTYGKNILAQKAKKSFIQKFFSHFKDVMVAILAVAALAALAVGDYKSTIIIAVVVVMNAALGVFQEGKAEKALEALKNMSSPYCTVKRDNQTSLVKSEDITVGDIVLLEAGNHVPADLRLLETFNLRIEESALTGESVPVEKSSDEIKNTDIVIGDRKNMAFFGSSVTYGRGIGLVTAVGMRTEMGRIAKLLSDSGLEQVTPLQKRLAEIGKYVSIIIVAVSVVIFIAGLLWGRALFEMFLTAISLAVAAIPEGLPAIVTIVLALGVQKMARQNAIVRKLPAVETLGSTEIICSDKTGTLTLNKMTVKQAYLDGKMRPAAEWGAQYSSFEPFLQVLVLCNDTKLTRLQDGAVSTIGDPTETALVDHGAAFHFYKDALDGQFPRVAEIPFDSERKLMTTIHRFGEQYRIMTKGAPDVLLDKCINIMLEGKVTQLSETAKQLIREANSQMAGTALRVLAVAVKDACEIPNELSADHIEKDLTFVGLAGMMDPPRPEAKKAVDICLEAGIRPIMITGDHRDTAVAIARELRIMDNENAVLTGSEMNHISEEEFNRKVFEYSVYARVSPEHKVRIVNAWRKAGKVVAMTGDGVNDAPALKASDISVGMGITGTDVAKGVSDIVLADDNFATIVTAVEEGRKIYGNLKKVVLFLLSTHLGEVVTLFTATMLNWVILYPIHLLWVNLIIDTLPALALGLEEAETDVMKRPPRSSSESFFAGGLGINILLQGTLKGLITLVAYYISLQIHSQEAAITTAFATMGLIQLAHALTLRSESVSIFRQSLFSNKYLIGAILLSAALQISVILISIFNDIFRVKQLDLVEWVVILIATVSIIPFIELYKWLLRMMRKSKVKGK